MIKEIKSYTLLCDNCGTEVAKNDDIEDCIDLARLSGWYEHKNKWYCEDCHYFDNGKLIIKKEEKND